MDLEYFMTAGRPFWDELEQLLTRMEQDPHRRLPLDQIRRFHFLYQRASADLSRLVSFSADNSLRRYLETLVGRSYAEIHDARHESFRFRDHVVHGIPCAFRRRFRAFCLALAVMMSGAAFGGAMLLADPHARETLLPFPHLQGSPSDRVEAEESAVSDRLKDRKAGFSSFLMTHNIRISIAVLALGMTWGAGTLIMLFYNGVILGAVCLDYILSGEIVFLAGWLMPHGSVEIPAVLLAGQGGLTIASALIGWGRPISLRDRFRQIAPDLSLLFAGICLLLIWAGIVEAFFSQYHEPVIPYAVKIAFGAAQLCLLFGWLARSGRGGGMTEGDEKTTAAGRTRRDETAAGKPAKGGAP